MSDTDTFLIAVFYAVKIPVLKVFVLASRLFSKLKEMVS